MPKAYSNMIFDVIYAQAILIIYIPGVRLLHNVEYNQETQIIFHTLRLALKATLIHLSSTMLFKQEINEVRA